MIRVMIEIYDGKRVELASIVGIKNDRTGDPETGNYDVELVDGGTRETYLRARVDRFPRAKKSVLQLVRQALNAIGVRENHEMMAGKRRSARA